PSLLDSSPTRRSSDLQSLEIPDEQQIYVSPDGQIILNEQLVAAPGDVKMPQLVTILQRFKQAADANKSQALVTLNVADDSNHQRDRKSTRLNSSHVQI